MNIGSIRRSAKSETSSIQTWMERMTPDSRNENMVDAVNREKHEGAVARKDAMSNAASGAAASKF